MVQDNEIGTYFVNSIPCTPTTFDSKDAHTEDGVRIIHLLGRKIAKKEAKEKAEDPLSDLMIKKMSALGTTTLRRTTCLNDMSK